MPKLRNAESDIGQFVQWIGRKCRHHHPLEELKLNSRAKVPDQYQKHSYAVVLASTDRDDILVYKAAGRVFVITVEESSEADVAKYQLAAVA